MNKLGLVCLAVKQLTVLPRTFVFFLGDMFLRCSGKSSCPVPVCSTCIQEGALTNEKNNLETTPAPELSLALVSLSIPLPRSIAHARYLHFCFPNETLGSAPKGCESLYGMGPSPLPPSREAAYGGAGGTSPVLHLTGAEVTASSEAGSSCSSLWCATFLAQRCFSEDSMDWVWRGSAGLRIRNFDFKIGFLAGEVAWEFRKSSLW